MPVAYPVVSVARAKLDTEVEATGKAAKAQVLAKVVWKGALYHNEKFY